MPDYSFFIGAEGTEGLEKLITMIRFDKPIQIYIVPVKLNDDRSFDAKNNENVYHKFSPNRMVSLRNPRGDFVCEVYYNPETDRYYINLAKIAPILQTSTMRFLEQNINGKYGNYHLSMNSLVKVLSE